MMPDAKPQQALKPEQEANQGQSTLLRYMHSFFKIHGQPGEACSVVMVTCPSQEVAKNLAKTVVTARLAACVNLISGVTSIYEWEDSLCEETEVLLLIKTQDHLLEALCDRVQKHHPHEVPEFIVLPLLAASEPYWHWLKTMTSLPLDSNGA